MVRADHTIQTHGYMTLVQWAIPGPFRNPWANLLLQNDPVVSFYTMVVFCG